jgi:F-type H+-transporting ATPase subunit epsilon
MSNTLHLIISSVSENLYDGPALSATLPGSAGQMTILPHHEPLISTLKEGRITVRISDVDEKVFAIDSGVLEVSGERAVVLV